MKSTVLALGLVAAIVCFSHDALAQRVAISSPAPEQILPGPDVTVRFHIEGANLRPGGNNVHFMLDNDPFEVQYSEGHSHVFKDVAPGTHTIRAYLANKMHEAIRGSLAVVTFSVAYPDTANRPTPGQPMLTYNLPQGEYLGIDAGDVTLDYLISDSTLRPGGCKVAYYVDGRRFFVEDGMPRHLKNLTPGYHVVRLELQDQYGDLIDGPFNSVERTILLSPGNKTNSAGVLESKYPSNVPRVNSIRGAMTMGRPWKAVEPVRPMTEEQIRRSQSLTVRHPESDSTQQTEVETTTERTDLMEAPEVTSEETQTRSSVTITEDSPAEAPGVEAEETTTERRTETSGETRLTTSGRRLDNRLERQRTEPVTATLRADAPTTSGRSAVRKVRVNSGTTTGTSERGEANRTPSVSSTPSAPALAPLKPTAEATPVQSPTPSVTATPAATPASTPFTSASTPAPPASEATPATSASTPATAPEAGAATTTSSAGGTP